MKKIKRILVMFLLIGIIFNSLFLAEVKAEPPNEFWNLQTEFLKALEESNNRNIIYYGEKIIALYRPVNLNDRQAVEICATKSGLVAIAYEALGDYENAIKYYKEYIPLGNNLEWTDGVYNATMKISHLTFCPDLYIKSSDVENNIFYNAKNEPKSGTYAGIVPFVEQNDAYKNIANKEGSYLAYYSYGHGTGSDSKDHYLYYKSTMEKAAREKKSVEYAFNVYSDNDFRYILNERVYIEEVVDFLASYDVPVFLRFGGEMNGTTVCDDPQAFISAFRFVADIVKAHSNNIAMVFGPQAIASREKPFQKYYPGDEYVDWVGVSQYSMKYFLGNTLGVQNANDCFFVTGEYCNPLTAISLIVNEYGGRKPIMLSECGVSNYAKSDYINEDLVNNQWAQSQMQRLYSYAPMIFPQLKAMYYFNVDRSAYEYDRYSLFNSPVMANLYNEITAGDNFLGSTDAAPSFRYKKVVAHKTNDSMLELSTYAVYPKTFNLQVDYCIDGKLVERANTIPYNANIDTSSLTNGTHTLEVSIAKDSTVLKIMKYQIIKDAGKVIIKKEIVFADVSDGNFGWAKAQIENLMAGNIINGVEIDGLLYYKPEQNITRAEFAKLVIRAFNISTVDQICNFSDVNSTDWYYPVVAAAYNSGIVKGRPSGDNILFAPNEPITRQDMCVIISNALLSLKGMPAVDDSVMNEALCIFGDRADIDEYAKKSIAFSIVNKIVQGADNGYGVANFRPHDNANRAEAAIVITNEMKLTN